MTLGRLTGTQTFGENRVFTGMDITAEYRDPKSGKAKLLSFHYAYYTNNLRGMVEKALDAALNGKPTPELFSNIDLG
jgi:hypothetical protein